MPSPSTAALVSAPVGASLIRMTVPMTVGLLCNMLFNLVDTFYVSRLGARELAAMGFTFPVVFFVTGSAMGMGIGVASTVSRAIGQGSPERVRRLVSDSLLLALCLVAGLVITGLLIMDRLFLAMGAAPDLIPLIREYMVPLFSGIGFLVVPMIGNSSIRATGDTLRPSLIMLTAGILNVILDPLLIFGIWPFPRLELRGAAIATVVSYAVVCVIMFVLLRVHYKLLTFRLGGLRSVLRSWREVLEIALPAILTNQMIPVANGVITGLVARHGEAAVAAWGVGTRLESLMMAPCFAMSTVMAPFVGQNHGAGRKDRIQAALRFSGKFCVALGLLLWALAALAAPWVASRFSRDPEVLRWIVLYLMVVPACYGVFGWQLQFTSAFNAERKPLLSSAVFLSRFFLFMIPLAHLGNQQFGLHGVFVAIALANGLACLVAILLWNYSSRLLLP